MIHQDPSLYRRRLRSELRRLREANEISQREVALAMDWSLSKLIRIETGAVTITTNDLRALLAYYGLNDPEKVEHLLDEARRSRERSPFWAQFKGVASNETLAMCAYEASARTVRNFEPLVVPGLLQIEDYAADLFKHLRGAKDPRRLGELVKLRLQRQELLVGGDGSQTWHFLMDEAVIRRVVGGPQVMRKQLRRIQELMELPHITVGVVPFAAGMYRGLRVPYAHFEFSDPKDHSVLYLENPEKESIISEDEDMTAEDEGYPTPPVYLELFWELEQRVSSEETDRILNEAVAALA
jgi:transcriptional regulator with XRE-family HTH domain